MDRGPRAYEAAYQFRLLNTLSLKQTSQISKLSKSYISQVKHGKCPPSKKLLDALKNYHPEFSTEHDYFNQFIQSRKAQEVSPGTEQFYRIKLGRFLSEVNADKAQRQDIEAFLLHFGNPGNRHAYYRAIKTFYNWRQENFGSPSPMGNMRAPKLAKLILPTLTAEQVSELIDKAESTRDEAIISMFAESGLRLSELVGVKLADIDWENKTIQVLGKGRKEALAPLGNKTQTHLKIWLTKYKPEGNVWGVLQWGVISMLRRLEKSTGITAIPMYSGEPLRPCFVNPGLTC